LLLLFSSPPGEDALGRRVWTDFEGEDRWTTIVGVVGDTRNEALGTAPRPQLYWPHVQVPTLGMALVVRTRVEPLGFARGVREVLWALDPDVPVDRVRTLEQVARGAIATPRLVLSLLVGAVHGPTSWLRSSPRLHPRPGGHSAPSTRGVLSCLASGLAAGWGASLASSTPACLHTCLGERRRLVRRDWTELFEGGWDADGEGIG